MPNFNKVTLIGHVTRDVEVRNTQGGTAVASIGLAVNHEYGKGEERKKTVCFVDCKAWGRQAEVAGEFIKKGDPLFVEGRLDYQTWEDKATGAKRSKHEVVVENFQFLTGAGKPAAAGKRGASRDDESTPF